MFRILYGVRVSGLERLPKTGALLICSNHRSNFDPPLIGSLLNREVSYFAKSELFRIAILGAFLRKLNAFPVKRGQMDKSAMSTCLKVLQSDGALVFFPEGTRGPANGFLAPKFGVGWVLYKSKATVVPIYLHGTACAKAFSGTRPNLEIVIGHPIAAELIIGDVDANRNGYQQLSERILELIRTLSMETTIARIEIPGSIESRDTIEDEKLR